MPYFSSVNDLSTNVLSYTWVEDTNTGVKYIDNKEFGLMTNGVVNVRLNSNNQVALATSNYVESVTIGSKVFAYDQYLAPATGPDKPMYSFAGANSNTGIYLSSNGGLGFAIEGVTKLNITPTSLEISTSDGFTAKGQYIGIVGSESNPSYSFASNLETGMFLSNASQLAFTIDGTTKLVASFNEIVVPTNKVRTSNQYLAPDSSTPMFSFTEGSNTGMYRKATDGGALAFAHNGVEKISVSATGTFITGDVSVAGDMTVTGLTTYINTSNLTITDNVITINKDLTGAPPQSLVSGFEVNRGTSPAAYVVYQESSSLFKIGPCNDLQAVATRDDALLDYTYAFFDSNQSKFKNVTSSKIALSRTEADTIKIFTSDVECARFNSNGFLGVMNAAPVEALDVTGNIKASGNISAGGRITSLSDKTTKTDIEQITDSIDKLVQLTGYTFAYKSDPSKTRQMGVMAQECLEVVPEVVGYNPDGTMNVSYGGFAGLFIECLKDLNARVTALETK